MNLLENKISTQLPLEACNLAFLQGKVLHGLSMRTYDIPFFLPELRKTARLSIKQEIYMSAPEPAVSIDKLRARKNNLFYRKFMSDNEFIEKSGAYRIYLEIPAEIRQLVLVRCHMEYIVNAPQCFHPISFLSYVTSDQLISFVQDIPWPFPRMNRGAEVIENPYPVSFFSQCVCDMAPNKACSSGNKNHPFSMA